MNKKGTSNLRLILALSVIIVGTFGAVFWGVGIGIQSNFFLWVGRTMIAVIPFGVALMGRWLK